MRGACATDPVATGACTSAGSHPGISTAWLWLVWCGLLVWSGAVSALAPQTRLRDYAQDRWGVEDGLPQLSVLSLTEDADGYLWVGTQNGLARFDGLRFTVFDRARTGIDTTFINHALLAADGQLWFGTPRGVLRWAAGRLQAVSGVSAQLSVNALAEAGGRIWVGSDLGLFVATAGGLRPEALAGEPVTGLLADAKGGLLAGGVGQVLALDAAGVVRQRWALARPDLRVLELLRDAQGLWLGTQDGLWRLDPASGQLESALPELRGQVVEALLADADGQLWVGATAALLRRQADGTVHRFGADESLERPWVHALYADRRGDLWIGTHRESLLRLADSAVRWLGRRDGLADEFVWSVLADGAGGAWIGSNSGLQRLDAAGRVWPDQTAGTLPQPHVYNLAQLSPDVLLIGTRAGLGKLRDDGRVEVPAGLEGLAGEQINTVVNAGDSWWIGTLRGLWRFRAGRLEHLGPPSGSADARVRSILPLADGALLLGTEGGIREWRQEGIRPLRWAGPLEGQFVARLKWLKPGLLGIATMDAGLGLMRDDRLLLLSAEHGLPTRNAWTLDVLDGYLYVASIEGVYRLALDGLPDPAGTGMPARIDAEQVFRGRGRARSHRAGCCNGGADARSARLGQQLLYTSTNGVVLVDTARIPRKPPAPRAVVEELRNGAAAFLPAEVPPLSGGSRDIAIDYTGLSLREPETIEFRYRLAGDAAEWQEVGRRRTAFFTHLPPGEYRFEVQARHPFGDWQAAAGSAEFRIVAQWYEWWWLKLGAALLAAVLVLWRWRARARAFRRRELELERAVATRTAELAEANTLLKQANQRLEQESRTDPLTGLNNRRALLDSDAQCDCTVAMIDLDHFKRVNDQHGHAIGDRVLTEFAGLLANEIRPDDLLARWGGEEFLVVLSRMRPEQARGWAERVRARVAAHGFALPDGSVLKLSVSIGLAGDPVDWQRAQGRADDAMYRAKRAGRNCVISC